MTFMNSTTDPGQPWVRISGRAPGSAERTCRKWTFCPSMVVVNWANAFSFDSWSRQS